MPNPVPPGQLTNYRFRFLKAPGLRTAQKEVLRREVCGTTRLPLVMANEGRTRYTSLAEQPGKWPTDAAKVKGAGGLRLQGASWCDSAIKPEIEFIGGRQLHLAIDDQVQLSVIKTGEKTLNTLGLSRAHTEFSCQNSLAAADLGFPGLAYGSLLDRSGHSVRDRFGHKLGVAITAHERSVTPVGNFASFCLAENSAGIEVVVLPTAALGHGPQGAAACVANYLGFAERTAYAKMSALRKAGLARHAGHLDNFLFLPRRDVVYVSDTDSCQLFRNLPKGLWGPQLLRDIASDTFRSIESLSFAAFTSRFPNQLAQGEIRPFDPILRGYFRGLLTAEEIQPYAESLHQAYLTYVSERLDHFSWLAEQKSDAFTSQSPAISVEVLRNTWQVEHVSFITDCLRVLYYAVRQSSLAKEGFSLPDISEGLLHAKFRRGVKRYYMSMIYHDGSALGISTRGECPATTAS